MICASNKKNRSKAENPKKRVGKKQTIKKQNNYGNRTRNLDERSKQPSKKLK